jgi:hypothetical protein
MIRKSILTCMTLLLVSVAMAQLSPIEITLSISGFIR